MRKGNPQNLKPFNKMPREQAAAIQSAGGKANSAQHKRLRAIREILDDVLSRPLPHGAADLGALTEMAQQIATERGCPLDAYEGLVLAQLAVAFRGDTRAATFIRDSAGDKPVDYVENSVGVTDGDRALLEKLQERVSQEK